MKTALITGASGGIGQACALAFAGAGYHTAIHYHTNRKAADHLLAQIQAGGWDGYQVRADLADENAVQSMFADVIRTFGGVDVLVNCAGIAQIKLFTDTAAEDWNRVMQINAAGTFLCCREAVRDMLKRKAGAIVNLSSMWGQAGASCEVAYSASKAAVIGLTKALAKETGPSGIRVNCICPGYIETEMNAGLAPGVAEAFREETPLQRNGTPQDVAAAALFLAGEASGFLTGQVIGVNGGLVV
ncbi:MAG: 3-oxoacyl-ACP reductase FabG [Clostridiales bacterium]|nr:3-oxoacyl-ACP reductase FabG [Clostridiales bacterium]